MAGNIKGITIEIDGSTTGLDKALKDVNSQSVSLQNELKQIDRLLKFNPGNTELIAQKQGLLAQQVQVTTEKLNRLKDAQKQVEDQFSKGEIGADQYRAFQREIIQTESKLSDFKQKLSQVGDVSLNGVKQDLFQVSKEAENAGESVKNLGGELTNLVAGAAAGVGIAGVVEKALDTSSLDTKIKISMEWDEGYEAVIREAVSTVQAYGVDAEAALEGVRRQWALNKDASDESNQAVVNGAATIVAAYGDIDFTELIQETNELSKTLEISNEEALALTYSLLKTGFPPDQLDIITEYGTQLHNAGYSAQEIQAIMAAGVETGSWNIDVLLDGLKEGRIRLAEFGQEVPKATAELLQGTSISSQKLQEWGQAVAKGGEGGKKAMTEVATAIDGIDDKTKQNAIGVAVFGTLWEENGTKITDTILGMNDNLRTSGENMTELSSATETLNADPAIQMQQAMTNLQIALTPLLVMIAEFISIIAEWISNNPVLAATITAIVTVLGIFMGIAMALVPILTAISAGATAFGIGLLPLAGIIAGVIAAIAAVIAIGVLLYKNWDEIKAYASQVWGSIKEFLSTTWDSIKETAASVWNSIKEFFSSLWEGVKSIFSTVVGVIFNILDQYWNNMKSGVETVWNGIKQFFQGVWDLIKNIFLGALLIVIDLLTGHWDNAKSHTQQVWDNIKEALSNIWEGIKSVFSGALQAVLGFVKTNWNNIKTATSEVWNSIKSTVSELVESIKNAVRDKFQALKDAVSEKMAEAKDKITEIWNNVMSFFREINLFEIGKNIIQGLIDGIASMASALMEKAKAIANSIKETIKGALDIHSPSRVMMELGEYTGEGFAIGIQSTIGEIAKASRAMGAVVNPSVTTVTVPEESSKVSSNSGVGINQTVNVYSPTALSPSEVARQNRRVLQELALQL